MRVKPHLDPGRPAHRLCSTSRRGTLRRAGKRQNWDFSFEVRTLSPRDCETLPQTSTLKVSQSVLNIFQSWSPSPTCLHQCCCKGVVVLRTRSTLDLPCLQSTSKLLMQRHSDAQYPEVASVATRAHNDHTL